MLSSCARLDFFQSRSAKATNNEKFHNNANFMQFVKVNKMALSHLLRHYSVPRKIQIIRTNRRTDEQIAKKMILFRKEIYVFKLIFTRHIKQVSTHKVDKRQLLALINLYINAISRKIIMRCSSLKLKKKKQKE